MVDRALPIFSRDLLVVVAMDVGQGLETVGLLEDIEVLALKVLDEGDLHGLVVLDVHVDAGQVLEADVPGGHITPFSGDDLEAAALGPDEDGLEDALAPDRILELFDIAELAAGLVGIRVDLLDGDHADPGSERSRRDEIDEMAVVFHSDRYGQS